jgi:hypothetical protein
MARHGNVTRGKANQGVVDPPWAFCFSVAMPDASKVTRARQILAQYQPWIDRYKGGLPRGWLAAIVMHESDGNPAAPGDASLGESGLMQVAAYVPPLFGFPESARLTSENNIAIGSLEYAFEAVKWYLRYPTIVRLGTADSWKLARLSFAVGRSGSYQLADLAKSYWEPGRMFDAILRHVTAFGAPALGSQSPDKVRNRVLSIPEQWAIGEAVDSSPPGPPMLIPNPPAGAYRIPAKEAPYFVKPIGLAVAALFVGGAGLLYYLWTQRA